MSEPTWEPLGVTPIDYIGAWSAAVAYAVGSVVRYNGNDYLAVNPSTGVIPPTVPGLVAIGAPLVTTFPVSPFDGQEVILVDSLSAPTYAWRFRYTPSITDAYKWLFVGGSPGRAAGGGMTLTATGYIYITNSWHFVVPRSGVYRWVYGCKAGNGGTFAGAYQTMFQVTAYSVAAVGAVLALAHHGAVYDGAAISTDSEATLTAGWDLMLAGQLDRTGSNTVVDTCWIQITPVRVA